MLSQNVEEKRTYRYELRVIIIIIIIIIMPMTREPLACCGAFAPGGTRSVNLAQHSATIQTLPRLGWLSSPSISMLPTLHSPTPMSTSPRRAAPTWVLLWARKPSRQHFAMLEWRLGHLRCVSWRTWPRPSPKPCMPHWSLGTVTAGHS